MTMDLAWILATVLLAVAIVLYSVYVQGKRPKDIVDAATQLLQAAVLARELVQAAEQLWLTGKIRPEDRLDYALLRLRQVYPGLTQEQLRALVESAVFAMKKATGEQKS